MTKSSFQSGQSEEDKQLSQSYLKVRIHRSLWQCSSRQWWMDTFGSELCVCSCFVVTSPSRQSALHYLTCFHGGGRKPVTSEPQYIRFDLTRMCNTQNTFVSLSSTTGERWKVRAVCAPDMMLQMELCLLNIPSLKRSLQFWLKIILQRKRITSLLQLSATFWSFPATVDH